jgi:hypothetical protein
MANIAGGSSIAGGANVSKMAAIIANVSSAALAHAA